MQNIFFSEEISLLGLNARNKSMRLKSKVLILSDSFNKVRGGWEDICIVGVNLI